MHRAFFVFFIYGAIRWSSKCSRAKGCADYIRVLMTSLLLRIYDYFQSRKPMFYFLTASLFMLLAFKASHIRLEEDVTAILPGAASSKEINGILKNSGIADKVVVKIMGRDLEPEELIQAAESVSARLMNACSGQLVEIQSGIDEETAQQVYQTTLNYLPIFLEEEDYLTIDSLTTTTQVAVSLEQNYELLTSPSGIVMKRLIADDPLGISASVFHRMQGLQVDNHYELYDGHIFSKDLKSLYLFVLLKSEMGETAKNEALFEEFDQVISQSEKQFERTKILYYGNPVVASDNSRQLKKDTQLTLSITVLAILLLVGYFFRRKRAPFVMLLPVLFGGLFSLALISLFRGSISSVALGAGSIVMGIAVNYSIHFFTHYRHCGSVKQTISDLLSPVTIGSFTTIGSFLSLTLLQSPILNDFGWFAGLSLTGASLFSLIFLPHFMPPLSTSGNSHVPLENGTINGIITRRAGVVSIAIILLTIFFFRYAADVRFESDLNKVNFMSEKTYQAQKEIDRTQDDTSKLVFMAAGGSTNEDMLQCNERLQQHLKQAQQQGWVEAFSSPVSFIPSHKMQEERINRWNNYWTEQKKSQTLSNLKQEAARNKFRPEAFVRFDSLLRHKYRPASEEDLNVFRKTFAREYLLSDHGKQIALHSVRVDKVARPQLYKELSGLSGVVILDKQIITTKLVEMISDDFNRILLYTSSLVFIALLFTYGRLELTIITFLPMVITWIWILGIMGLAGFHFNLINIVISTFIFGLGDDFGIFMTDGLMRKYREGKEILSSHKTSILLAALTVLAGMGALLFARHPALRSVALVSIIGICSVVIVGQIIQPMLFNFFAQNRRQRGLAPWTFTTLALTGFSYTYFALSALVLTIIGLAMFYLMPFIPMKQKKSFFHYMIYAAIKSLAYIMVNVRKRHLHLERMDFSKPAIIIANHTSVLDILVTVMQHPKLILLTNRWVYHSPVFGKVVQMADYYPAMEGVNPALDKFEEIVKDGYSIVIFPEGTRSVDGKIKRFHKGAFYLAEKLKLDIVPLVIHGGAHSLRKGDFLIFNGKMTMKYLPRITPDDLRFGNDYSARAKNITAYFRQEYEKLRAETEIPAWFRQRLVMNYIYKGWDLEWEVRKQARRESYYDRLHSMLPKQGIITELGCGAGFTTYMLHFLSPERRINAFDGQVDKIDIANHCFSKNEKLSFDCSDMSVVVLHPSHAFLLHANRLEQSGHSMTDLLDKCFQNLLPGGSVIVTGTNISLPDEFVADKFSDEVSVIKRK